MLSALFLIGACTGILPIGDRITEKERACINGDKFWYHYGHTRYSKTLIFTDGCINVNNKKTICGDFSYGKLECKK